MKKLILSLTLLISLVFPTTNSFAQTSISTTNDSDYTSNESNEFEASGQDTDIIFQEITIPSTAQHLQPSKETKKNLEKAYWYVNESGEKVYVTKMKVTQAERGKSFKIIIDSSNNEYTITNTNSQTTKTNSLSSLMSTNYFVGVTYTTEDPVNVALNRSKHELTWGSDGTDSWKVSRYASAWAANPSTVYIRQQV